jgi:hypothetical protein
MVKVQIGRSKMARLDVVLDLRGQGGEIELAAVIDNNDRPM